MDLVLAGVDDELLWPVHDAKVVTPMRICCKCQGMAV